MFTSKARVEVLKLFFLRSSKRHYLREIALLTDQPVRGIQRELARLEEVGILLSESEGNRRYFRPNRDLPVFSDLRSLLIKTAGFVDTFRDVLQEDSGAIRLALIFGSFARGTETVGSDLDLLVVGSITGRRLARSLKPAKAALGREINPVIMRVDEVVKRVENKDPFIQRVLQEPMIFLLGDEHELRALAG